MEANYLDMEWEKYLDTDYMDMELEKYPEETKEMHKASRRS